VIEDEATSNGEESGDDDALVLGDAWIRDRGRRVLVYARTLLRDDSEAADAVQEAMLALLQHQERYDLARDGERILFTIVTNRCRNMIRDRSVRERRRIDDPEGELLGEIPDPTVCLPDEVAMGGELADAIEALLDRLPLQQRAVLHLAALGKKREEIASILSIKPEHASVLLYRARRSLARVLPHHGREVRE
jgi:RNA polymerase sigma-70 factor (ECF subfamily)